MTPVALELFCTEPAQQAEASPDAPAVFPDASECPEPPPCPEPEIDPEAEMLESLSRIAAALETIVADQSSLTARRIANLAAALGSAAESILPRLAGAGFAALVAETAERVAREGRWPRLELRAAEGEAAEIAKRLAGDPSAFVEVTADGTLGPGEVRLGWTDGGAEIDLEQIAATALERVRRALEINAEE